MRYPELTHARPNDRLIRRVAGAAEDLPWKQFTARLVRAGRATALPVHVRGQNGPLLHLVRKWSQTMRCGLLVGAFAKLYGRSIRLTAGAVIPPAEAEALPAGRRLAESLRAAVLALA